MNPHVLVAVASLLTQEPVVAPPPPDAPQAREAAPGQSPTESSPPEPSSSESLREQAIKRSKVPRYPKLDRPWVFGSAAVGVGLGLASGLYYFKARSFQKDLDNGIPTNRGELHSTVQSGRQARTTALILGGASALSFGVTAYFLFQPFRDTGTAVALVPGNGGGTAVVSGRLP